MNAKPEVSLHLCAVHNDDVYDTVRCIVWHDTLTVTMPSMTLSEALAFIDLIDSRRYRVSINGEGMPKRAAFFKVENAKADYQKYMSSIVHNFR